MRELWNDIAVYGRLWWKYTFWRGYRVFRGFEGAKGVVAGTLYRQRGRFAQPFVHIGMAVLVG